MTDHNRSRYLVVTLILMLGLGLGCHDADSSDPTALPLASVAAESSPNPSPSTARIVAGLIVRDQETERLIAETAAVTLAAGAGSELHFEVLKSRYRLEVWRGQQRLKVYPVGLGGAPVGAKQQAGDHRTPEGTYLLRPHHPSPGFCGCFYLCYPSRADAQRGLAAGLIDRATAARINRAFDRDRRPPHDTRLGGLILIHGTCNREQRGLTKINWTDGCISLENRDVVELLAAFSSQDRPQVSIKSFPTK